MSDFDDLFKDRFSELETDVPDDMWSRIQANQAPEDVKKPVLIYWKWSLLGICLVALIISSVFILGGSTAESENINIADHVENPKFDPTYDNDLSKLLVASRNIESLHQSSEQDALQQSDQKYNSTTNTVTIAENSSFSKEKKNNTSLSSIIEVKATTNSSINYGENDTEPVLSSLISSKNSISHIIEQKQNLLDVNLLPDYDKKCPKFGKSLHGYYSVELYHGSDFNTKNINARQEEFNDYALDRSNTEKRRYSYSNGVKFKWHNSAGLEVGIGLERSVIRERFEFMENAREVKVLISIDTIFSSDGSFTTSTDTTRVDIPGMKQNSITNKYTSIDIPILLGYQFELKRWAIGINAGIYINLLQQQNGRILGLNGKPAWIGEEVDNSQNIFKSKTGLKFDGSISIVYHLTPDVDILAQPYFRYNSHSYTEDSYPLEQFYHTAGIRAGVRYNFGF